MSFTKKKRNQKISNIVFNLKRLHQLCTFSNKFVSKLHFNYGNLNYFVTLLIDLQQNNFEIWYNLDK